MKNIFYLLIFITILIGCPSSDPTKKPATLSLNEFIYYTMKDSYLWYDTIPSIEFNNYNDPQELVDALTYKPLDKWSYIYQISDNPNNLKENQYMGYGFGFIWSNEDSNYVLRVSFVYNDSPAKTGGLKRGQKILKINNIEVKQNPTDDDKKIIYDEISNGNEITLTVSDLSDNV
ncbi:MAG TPA: PDZ domain-containing protein, partial [Spirochaetota bacterium]|nr:PDZ domain-containing protein [Spirochaetota bacterium]